MLTRRDVVTTALVVPAGVSLGAPVAGASLPVPPDGRIGFRMLRNGDVVGSHGLNFAVVGDQLVVSVAIDILVKFMGVGIYRYSHRATERWQGDRFMGIESRTDRDGSPREMKAMRGPEGMVVTGTRVKRYIAPETALPTTYWNRAMVAAQVINSEDGRLMLTGVTEGPIEQVRFASGATTLARRYGFGGELTLDLWYDTLGQWAHLQFTSEGSTIIYEKL